MSSNPTRSLRCSPRELVVVTRADAKVTVNGQSVISDPDFDVTSLNKLLESEELRLRPLFGLSEERLTLQADSLRKPGTTPTNLTGFKRLFAPDYRLEELAQQMIAEETVEAAFIKPGVTPAIWFRDLVPDLTAPVNKTPNFTHRQGYLNPADEGGIDARFAWTKPGGQGDGIRIIDVEGAWCFEHDDLNANQGGIVAGKASLEQLWRDHGTAVLGIISGDANDRGITGICPQANISAVSVFELLSVKGWGTAAAITQAAMKLNPGDILLLELQRAGPRVDFKEQQETQIGNIPVEWWPDDLKAIKFAINDRKLLVVTAGGNGREDLSDPIYDKRPDLPEIKFPDDWVNPFRRTTNDSGSIIVGAGGPPTSSHNLQRLEFSNFDSGNADSIFDAQGWGEEVTTTGFGDLKDGGGPDENFWYTGRFSGTSSAAPMIAGALACLQGIQRAKGLPPLTASEARERLRKTGRPQQPDGAKERIGRRPDLVELIESLPA